MRLRYTPTNELELEGAPNELRALGTDIETMVRRVCAPLILDLPSAYLWQVMQIKKDF